MMDSFELSKIAGAVLAALLIIVGMRTALHIFQHTPGEIKNGFTLPQPSEQAAAPAGDAGAPEAPAAAAFDAAKVVAMIATANPANGEGIFKKCLACHSAEKGAPSKAGPNLWGVVGRARASQADFSGYSEAMKAKGGEWTYQDLASFAHKPKEFLPGTKMIFPGVAEPSDVADLLAYMRTLADSPAPLPQ